MAAYVEKFGATVNVTFSAIVKEINAFPDPNNASNYYASFYDNKNYIVPEGCEVFALNMNEGDDAFTMERLWTEGDIMAANSAVIMRAHSNKISLTETNDDATPTESYTSVLSGTVSGITCDEANTAYYVLSGQSTDGVLVGVGFYRYVGSTIPANKAEWCEVQRTRSSC